MSFTQPLCDDCWDEENASRPSPRMGMGETEQCCMCGEETRSGIYTRVDPKTVPYPRRED